MMVHDDGNSGGIGSGDNDGDSGQQQQGGGGGGGGGEEENLYSYVNLVHNQTFFTLRKNTTLNDLDCHILTH